MADGHFSPSDPNGAAIRAASDIATAVRSGRTRRPVVMIGFALLGLAAVVFVGLAVLSY